MSIPQNYQAIQLSESGKGPAYITLPISLPSTNQVLIKVEYFPINPTDLIKLSGFYGKPANLKASLIGHEGSGVIIAVGDNLKVPHKVGDRVHIRTGSWAQYLTADSEVVHSILQEDLSLEEASAHWVNPAAVYSMGVIADRGGHKAAIHTVGSSALGRMLIRYFKHKGIKLINIVRKAQYIEELKNDGADYVLDSTSPDFETQLRELAVKEHVTLGFGAIGGDFTDKVLKAFPDNADAICYVYGYLTGNEVRVSINQLTKRKLVGGFTLFEYLKEVEQKGGWEGLQEYLKEIHELLPTIFKTRVEKVFSFDQIHEALAYYEDNSSKGKILIKSHS